MWFGGMSAIIIMIIMINGFLISLILIVDSLIGLCKYCRMKKSNIIKVEKLPEDSHRSMESKFPSRRNSDEK